MSLYFLCFSVCHAELNAIVNKYAADIRKCRMFVSLFPCNECAKIVIQSGITEVVYYSDKDPTEDEINASRLMLEKVGVKLRCVLTVCSSPSRRFELIWKD